jgi:hypothetical protein
MGVVGSHQQGVLTVPLNGTSPVNANTVRANDNAIADQHNAHDADATIHVQTSDLVSRPAPAVAGRLWFVTDNLRLYYDTGSAWVDLTIDAGDIDAGTLALARLPTITPAKGGTGLTATPTNGQIPIGDGSGFVLATITAGNNITVTNTAGDIRLDVTGLASGVSGSATGGTVPRMVGTGASSQIGTGSIQDDGTRVGIGQAPDATYRTATDSLRVTGASESHNGVPYTTPAAQGAANSVLTNNGSGVLSWTIPTQPLDQQTFNSSGTWTKPAQGSMALIEVWGAGGSGSAEANFANRHGGAGGGFMFRLVPLSSLGATETVTVGAGGASRTTAVAGQTGGNSSFGTWAYAYGGSGGYLGSLADVAVTPGTPLRAGLGGGSAQFVKGGSLSVVNVVAQFDYFDRTFAGGWASGDATDLGQLKNSVYGGGAGSCKSLANAGTSQYGGNGGAEGVAGTAPGGGGGAGLGGGAGVSGAGANGLVRITVW